MLAMSAREGDAAAHSAIVAFNDALKLLPGVVPDPEEVGGMKSIPVGVEVLPVSRAEVQEYLAETSKNLGDAWSSLTTGNEVRNRRFAVERYRTAARYYAGIPYYSPEYAEALQKLEALLEKERHHNN